MFLEHNERAMNDVVDSGRFIRGMPDWLLGMPNNSSRASVRRSVQVSGLADTAGFCFSKGGFTRLTLIGLLGIGFHNQIVLSHDSVWCWRGRGT